MFITDFNEAIVSQYMYVNRKNVQIIDTVVVNDLLFGRLDIIVNKYYPGKMEYLPLLMDFNRITDPTEIKIGTLIDIPDINNLILSMEVMDEIDADGHKVPGVLSSMVNSEVNTQQKNDSNKTKTTAIPKLNITLKKVSYDTKSGMIVY